MDLQSYKESLTRRNRTLFWSLNVSTSVKNKDLWTRTRLFAPTRRSFKTLSTSSKSLCNLSRAVMTHKFS